MSPEPDRAKVEVLKVWYSVFCTLMDAKEYNDAELLAKLRQLRKSLAQAVPEVEELMARHHQ